MTRPARTSLLAPIVLLALFAACVNNNNDVGSDAGSSAPDGGGSDSSPNPLPPVDSGAPDATLVDSAAPDTGAPDAGGDAAAATDAADAGAATDAADAGSAADAADAAADAADAGVGTYVDAVNGSDTTGTGTPLAPFKTIAKAATVATSGMTIRLAAGTYTGSTTSIADGVGVEALTPGQATIAAGSAFPGSYSLLTFAGSGSLGGVVMNGVYTHMSAGTVTVAGVRFDNIIDNGNGISDAGLMLSGTAHVILTPGGLTNYFGASSSILATITGGFLEVHGGTVDSSVVSPFSARGVIAMNAGSVLFDAVTISNSKNGGIYAGGTANVTVQNGSLLSNCQSSTTPAGITQDGTPTITVDNSTITGSGGYGIGERNPSTSIITVRNNTVITASATGGILIGSGTLILNGASVTNNTGDGIDVGAATLDATNSVISGNTLTGISSNAGNGHITLRGTQISGHPRNGIYVVANPGAPDAGAAASAVVDLGTPASAGGNTFTGNGTSAGTWANLDLLSTPLASPVTYYAVGNTWSANVQTADAAGHFPSPTTFTASSASNVSGTNILMNHYGTGGSVSVVMTP